MRSSGHRPAREYKNKRDVSKRLEKPDMPDRSGQTWMAESRWAAQVLTFVGLLWEGFPRHFARARDGRRRYRRTYDVVVVDRNGHLVRAKYSETSAQALESLSGMTRVA